MSTHTEHITALHARFVRPIPYRLVTRVRDAWLVGRRDAVVELAHEAPEGTQPSASLRELEALHRQRCELELLSATRIAARLLDARRELSRSLEDLRAERAVIEERLASDVVPDEVLTEVRHAESMLRPEQRAARRRREHVAALASQRDRVIEIGRQEGDGRRSLADIDGALTTLFEGLQARVGALTQYYERRSANLIRAYLRRCPATDAAKHPLNTRLTITAPAWAGGPNPWLSVPVPVDPR